MKGLSLLVALLLVSCVGNFVGHPTKSSPPSPTVSAGQSPLPIARGCAWSSPPDPIGQSRQIVADRATVTGNTLAFVRDGSVFLLVPGGQPVLLVEDVNALHVNWSPDGGHLAYIACGRELRVIDLARRIDRTILLGISGNQQRPGFSGDGGRVFGVVASSPDSVQAASILDVAVGVDLNTATTLRVPMPPPFLPRGAGYPILYRTVHGSRSGKVAAWTLAPSPPQLVVFGPDGAVVVRRRSDSPAAWHPTADQLVFSTERGLILLDVAAGTERVLDPAGGTLPVWSPDGRRVAFMRMVSSTPQIYVVDSANGALTRLVREPSAFPTWSADGRWIAYAREGQTPRPDIWRSLGLSMVRADGSTPPTALTPDDGSSAPVFAQR